MTKKLFNFIFVTLLLQVSLSTFAQQKAYNDKYSYAIIRNSDSFVKSDSIQALIVNFESVELDNFCKSLHNNPQIKEVQLYNAPQSALDSLSSILGHSLTHLIIEEYPESSMYLKPFEALDMLSINSNVLISLDISSARLDMVYILAINSKSLTSWKTQSHFAELGLIDLVTPQLNEFSIKSAPRLGQFSFYCSFNEIPKFLCDCNELLFISFKNHKVIPLDDCFIEKISNAISSNITMTEGEYGKVVFELLSDDKK